MVSCIFQEESGQREEERDKKGTHIIVLTKIHFFSLQATVEKFNIQRCFKIVRKEL